MHVPVHACSIVPLTQTFPAWADAVCEEGWRSITLNLATITYFLMLVFYGAALRTQMRERFGIKGTPPPFPAPPPPPPPKVATRSEQASCALPLTACRQGYRPDSAVRASRVTAEHFTSAPCTAQ